MHPTTEPEPPTTESEFPTPHAATSQDDSENSPGTDKILNSTAITENPFDSESSRVLFDAVDRLQECGATRHHDLDIPQLVIVGGQSTGKSSLLQSLTDIPFPVGSGCCTRFATRIVSRRTGFGTTNKFKITIEKPEVKIEGFRYSDDAYKEYTRIGETLDAEEFEAIMDEVSRDYMGIKSGRGPNKKNFATQVLRVELSGPGRSHFSIVDVPGLFTNPHTVNEGEMLGIEKMIVNYMRQPENLVICVADAVTDLANQGIFRLANDHVTEERLVGVFTKCDMLRDAEEVVGIATGRQDHTGKVMRGGWFVVRNRSSKEDKYFDLASAEKQLFEQPPWNRIPIDRRGTSMLRKHLSTLLCARIRGNFPTIRRTIENLLLKARREREALGDPRPTHSERLQYLRDVIQKYEVLATEALEKPGLLGEELRLRNKVKEANEAFAGLMHKDGHTHQFQDPEIDPLQEVNKMKEELSKPSDGDLDAKGLKSLYELLGAPKGEAIPLTPPESIFTGLKAELGSSQREEVFVGEPVGKALMDDIREELRAFEGTQLPGLVNPEVMPVLFQKQTEKWQEFAAQHIHTVANHLSHVVTGILNRVCPPTTDSSSTLYDGLFNILARFWEESRAKALAEVDTFCHRERCHILQTTDSRFYERLKAWQTIRLLRSLASVPPNSDALAIYDRVHISIEDNMVDAVHDILKVYYQISIESFIRHITHNIVENFVSGSRDKVKGPLRGLSKDWLYSLGEDEVARLACEDELTISNRAKLDTKIRELRIADEIAAKAAEESKKLDRI